MSYIKIEIGGRERGLKFNQGALIMFQEKIEINNYAATTGYALIWAGLKANAYVKGEEFTENFETVCDWVDELPEADVLRVIDCFKETQAYKKLLPEQPEQEDKKKLPSRNIKRSRSK